MKTKLFFTSILILALGALSINFNTGCSGKKGSTDSTKTVDDNLSKIKQNITDYICKGANAIYFPETYKPLRYIVDTVYVNSDFINEKQDKTQEIHDLHLLDSIHNTSSHIYEKAQGLASYNSEIANLNSQIAQLDKQMEQHKNEIKFYKVFHAYNAKCNDNQMRVCEANIVVGKDLKIVSYTPVTY